MTLNDISHIRLANQQIAGGKINTAKDIVSWMGAMQAQDYNMAKWAIGLRLHEATDKIVEAAIDKGEVLRTHVLRPTWHFVSADDIYWMLELTAPRIKASLQSRHRELELTEPVYRKSRLLIERVLSGNIHLTREELITAFRKANINVDDNRSSHLLLWAELEGVICSGATKDKKQTYALLEERVTKKHLLPREEALAALALRYFSSHGPATVQDFAWWSGLSLTEARNALEITKTSFVAETIDLQTYWSGNFGTVFPLDPKVSVYLLPAFDEFIISYKDRSAALALEHHNKAVSNNGIFRPTLVVNGTVTGTWKRTIKNKKTIIETSFFEHHTIAMKTLIEEAGVSFGNFLGKEVAFIHKENA